MPTKDADLGPWSENFADLITATPANYGLVAGDAVAINAVVTPWLTALATATNPATRTSVTVAAKDAAKAAMRAVVMPYAVTISLNAAVSGALKTGVGVTDRITTKTRNSVVAVATSSGWAWSPTGMIEIRTVNPATPDTKARPLGANGWQLQAQGRNLITDPWVNTLDVVVTRPIFVWDWAPVSTEYVRFRTRWVGAALNGGVGNVGPWSEWVTVM